MGDRWPHFPDTHHYTQLRNDHGGMRMQDRRGTTGYRLTIWIEQTREEEATYRTAHQVSPDESLRTHLADHLTGLLEGEGALTGWWHILRIR